MSEYVILSTALKREANSRESKAPKSKKKPSQNHSATASVSGTLFWWILEHFRELFGSILHLKMRPKTRRKTGGFNGWEKIKENLEQGTSRIRVGILPEGKIIAREGTKIFSTNDEKIGTITSGTFGPSVNAPVSMGYIDQKFSEIGANIKLEVRGKKHNAQISKLPFYKKSYVK